MFKFLSILLTLLAFTAFGYYLGVQQSQPKEVVIDFSELPDFASTNNSQKSSIQISKPDADPKKTVPNNTVEDVLRIEGDTKTIKNYLASVNFSKEENLADKDLFENALSLAQQGFFLDAITDLYSLILASSPLSKPARQQINAFVKYYEEKLAQQNNNDALLLLYEHLSNLDKAPEAYYLKLAKLHYNLDNTQDAWRYLSLLEASGRFTKERKQLTKRINEDNKYASVEKNSADIELKNYKNKYVVTLLINGIEGQFLIDTGASISAIKESLIDEFDLEETSRTMRIHTASNTVRSQLFKASSFGVDGFELNNFILAPMNLPGSRQFDGLLGMDYLKHFEFSLDQNTKALSLQWR